MKQKDRIALIFFILGILLILIFNFVSYVYAENKLLKEISSHLAEDSEIKAEKINSYLSEIREGIEVLQESDEVKNLLRDELVFDESVIKANVGERSRIISEEVENYLKIHPKMTLKDLQKDETFLEIAVQPVGKEGYSFAYDTQTLINYFHKEPRRIGFDYNTMKETFPDLWKIFEEASRKDSAEGFYTRDEEDGSISHKYGKFVQLSVSTADGINISLGTTAYIDDYRIIEKKSDYLDSIKKNSDYYNIILISPQGHVIYMAEQIEDYYGTNLEWEVNLGQGLSNHYLQVRDTMNISFYGPFIESYGQIYPEFSIMAPVYDGDLLGYVAILDDMEQIFEVTKDTKNLGETGESYLINSEGILISSLRESDLNIMIQSINTKNARDCIEDIKIWKNEQGFVEKHDEEFSIYENYQSEEVFGTHSYVNYFDWCMISELKKSEINSFLRETLFRNFYISIVSLFCFLIGSLFINGNYDKIKKRFNNKRVRLFQTIFAIAIFCGLIFLIFIYFLKNPGKMLLGIMPEIFSLALFIFLFFYAMNKKNGAAKNYIMSGAFFSVFAQTMRIILEGHSLEGTFFITSTIFISVISFIGILLIFFGFKEALK